MNIVEHKPSSAVLELTIELDRADIERDLQHAAKHLSEHSNVPGFRKGTAPYDVVSRSVGGEAKIYEEAIQSIVGRTLESEIRERNVGVAGQPEISIQKMVPPFGITYKAVISILPSATLGDVSSIKVEKKEASATDKDVEKVITNLREMHAKESLVERPAGRGDVAVLDLVVAHDKVVVENGTSKDFKLTLGEGGFIPGFEEQIIGLKAGDKKEFELKFPDEYYEKFLAGKPAQFTVSVTQVFERILPELNDAFAKDLGHAHTMEDLRKQIRESLQHEREREERERFEMAAMDELVKHSTIGEFSDQLIVAEAQKMVAELERNVKEQGMRFEDYLSSIKKSKEDLALECKPKAEHRLKVSLVGREFGKQENISASEEEVAKELGVAKKTYQHQPELLARLESPEYRDYVRNMLTSRKIFKTLAEKVSQ
ncbi:trigger factor [bacterium CG10_46_32]|nr:MAG: trigger factor [bacterium CG10_46_32]PIR56121.1 MAG: trigger factor [Parcubacteria group bacterium CG10_big_fil_rev_8_21_14_0_10_46_32]